MVTLYFSCDISFSNQTTYLINLGNTDKLAILLLSVTLTESAVARHLRPFTVDINRLEHSPLSIWIPRAMLT